MLDAMEADQDINALSRRGSFYLADDSFLLSDYLHRQVEKAGNRFFNKTNSLLFLRSTLLLSELEQKELEENSDRFCFPEFNHRPLGLSAANKESSESFSGRECSSHAISELDKEKGRSSSPHKVLDSCVSYVGSSECCESAEAATRKEANSESLHNMQCLESRQAISLSIDEGGEEIEVEDADDEDDEDCDAKKALTMGFGATDALNLLVTAALQVDTHDGDQDCHYNAGMISLKKSSSHGGGAVHGNSLIVKRKVIRRARSAFPKQKNDDCLQKLELFETGRTAAKPAVGTHIVEQVNRKALVPRTKCRKLLDLSFDHSNGLTAAYTSLAKDSKGGFWAAESFGDGKEKILAVENLQALPAKISCSLNTEGAAMVHRGEENHEYIVNHRKLQVLSAKLSDAFDTKHSKGLQPRLENWKKQLEYAQNSPFSRKCLAARACITGKESKQASMERFRSQEEETCLGNPGLRLKILPIRRPSADLPLLQEVSKSESTGVSLEAQIATRKRRMSLNGEEVLAASLILHREGPLQDIQAKDGDPVIRSKRGRSQVLPTKFSDSVLQPWKTSRKRCKKKI